MVDGVHGGLDHAVRHVVEEHKIILECVIILNPHVKGKIVMVLVLIPTRNYAMMTFAVQVMNRCCVAINFLNSS